MAKDYSGNLATAKRLVRKFGRQVTLLQLDGAPADPSKPWEGSSDPRGTPVAQASTYAVAVSPGSTKELGLGIELPELTADVEQVLIAEPGEDDPENLENYHVVVDGGEQYKVAFVEKLKPANLTLLYFIGVSK